MTDRRHALGAEGEARAAAHLERAGYRIVAHNVRAGGVELDLIARRGETLVFVEVKTRQDRMLIGIDLRKDGRVLERAYDDSQGVTAKFNLNLLARINRELGGHFDTRLFDHRATWRNAPGRVESHLVSVREQRVGIDALGLDFDFTAGEAIHTENSHKYSLAEIDWLAEAAGMRSDQQWFDVDELYSLNLFSRAP